MSGLELLFVAGLFFVSVMLLGTLVAVGVLMLDNWLTKSSCWWRR